MGAPRLVLAEVIPACRADRKHEGQVRPDPWPEGVLRSVFHDSEPSPCATALRKNLSLDLLHHEWDADVIGHLLKSTDSRFSSHRACVLARCRTEFSKAGRLKEASGRRC